MVDDRDTIVPFLKAPTGIRGLDEITGGGLPAGRPTLVCGGPGCGKTLLATEFLVRGATELDEPGVFMAFEETAQDLAANVQSLGFDLGALVASGKLRVDHVRLLRTEIDEAGEYDLEGLFVRLGYAIDAIGAKRVVLDTIETLFAAFSNEAILRAELRRLFGWLKERGVTAVITAERGAGTLTRQGLEEYVSDCVILLDHRVDGQISTRRLRVVKYRGSAHGTNEYPFLIGEGGVTVLPITSAGLTYEVSDERVSSGIPELDDMLGGRGFYRGSNILLTGSAGTGKTLTASHFVEAACRRGERALYCSFEESPAQIVRNVRSTGADLRGHVDRGLLRFHAARPTLYGLEMHLARILKEIQEFAPSVVVLDPITSLLGAAMPVDVRAMATRLIDSLKIAGITAMFTSLVERDASNLEESGVGISSLVDTWIFLRDIELNGERNRGIYVLKARGIAHSNQIREFLITSEGVRLVDAYLGPEGVLTGSSRIAQEVRVRAAEAARREESERRLRQLARRRAALEAQIEALHAELDSATAEWESDASREEERQQRVAMAELDLARSRHIGRSSNGSDGGNGRQLRTTADTLP